MEARPHHLRLKLSNRPTLQLENIKLSFGETILTQNLKASFIEAKVALARTEPARAAATRVRQRKIERFTNAIAETYWKHIVICNKQGRVTGQPDTRAYNDIMSKLSIKQPGRPCHPSRMPNLHQVSPQLNSLTVHEPFRAASKIIAKQ